MSTQPNRMPNPAVVSPYAAPAAGKGWFLRDWKWCAPTVLIVFVVMQLAPTGTVFGAKKNSAEAAAPYPAVAAAAADQPGVIQTQESTVAGIVAELTECRRKEGVLNIKVRFRNTSNKDVDIKIIQNRNYEKYYVTAKAKKYFILKDSEGAYLTPAADGFGNLGVTIQPGASYPWWAKFPAPPADVKKITLITPITTPFDDAPITDQ